VLQAFQPARFEKTTVTGEALNHCQLPLRAFLAARFRKTTANSTECPQRRTALFSHRHSSLKSPPPCLILPSLLPHNRVTRGRVTLSRPVLKLPKKSINQLIINE
jgi:hypothetical protein